MKGDELVDRTSGEVEGFGRSQQSYKMQKYVERKLAEENNKDWFNQKPKTINKLFASLQTYF